MWLVICKEEGMRGLRRRSGVRQRGGRDCIQAREPRQPDPSSPPTPSTTLHWRAAGKPTVGFVASLFLEGASLRKTLKTCGFSPQETSCWKMVGLPCSPAPHHLFSVSCPMPMHLNTGCNPSLPGTLAVSVQNLPLVPDYTRA